VSGIFRKACRRFLEKAYVTEVIGQDECPMMLRWSIWMPGPEKRPWFKLLVHYFPPNVSDRDPHDHPRPFFTLILRGFYFNTEWEDYGGIVAPTIEMLRTGEVRYRPAKHTHIVETGDAGAWTLVLMGPEVRPWGFLRDGKWWPWKPYVEEFGGVVRCDTGELDEKEDGEYPPYRKYKGSTPFERPWKPVDFPD
jgi:hypothetical protein